MAGVLRRQHGGCLAAWFQSNDLIVAARQKFEPFADLFGYGFDADMLAVVSKMPRIKEVAGRNH